jgi:DNA-binding NtrC family response regulator
MSIGVLVKRSGLTLKALAQIEEGRVSLSLRSIDRLARGLGVPSAMLVVGPAPARSKGTRMEVKASLARIAALIVRLPAGREAKLDAVERAVTAHALDVCGGNQSAAARLLGMDRKAFGRLCRKWRVAASA